MVNFKADECYLEALLLLGQGETLAFEDERERCSTTPVPAVPGDPPRPGGMETGWFSQKPGTGQGVGAGKITGQI